LGAGLRGPRSADILRGCPSFRAFRETAGTFSKPRRGGCPHPPGWGLFPSHVGAGALTRPGGGFFCGVGQELLSHTFHSEERRDESLLSNTCHSESALAVRNLLFAKQWELFPSHVGAGALTCPIPFLSPLSS